METIKVMYYDESRDGINELIMMKNPPMKQVIEFLNKNEIYNFKDVTTELIKEGYGKHGYSKTFKLNYTLCTL